jgi:hypothetical protein
MKFVTVMACKGDMILPVCSYLQNVVEQMLGA